MKNTASKKTALLIALIATLIAVGVHAYLSQHFYGVKYGTLEGPSACNINSTFNCDAVSASSYASLFGVPIALFGLFANLVLLYFLAVTKWNVVQDSNRTSRYAFLLSLGILLASVVMGTISVTAVGNICLFCAGAYLLSIIGFIATWKAAENLSFDNIKKDVLAIFSSEKWVLGFLIAIPVFAAVANIMYLESKGLGDIEKIAKEKVAYWQIAPTENFDLTTGLVMQKGSAEPIMTIVEFADFRCSHCKLASTPLHNFTNNHSDVRLIYKPFPLDGTCNEALSGRGDGISCGLAFATMCAEKSWQKGWMAHDYIFENQNDIIATNNLNKNLEAIASHLQVDLEQLKTCVNGPEVREAVTKMAKEGELAKIQGTPAIFVNNKLLNGGQSIPILDAVYKSLK